MEARKSPKKFARTTSKNTIRLAVRAFFFGDLELEAAVLHDEELGRKEVPLLDEDVALLDVRLLVRASGEYVQLFLGDLHNRAQVRVRLQAIFDRLLLRVGLRGLLLPRLAALRDYTSVSWGRTTLGLWCATLGRRRLAVEILRGVYGGGPGCGK